MGIDEIIFGRFVNVYDRFFGPCDAGRAGGVGSVSRLTGPGRTGAAWFPPIFLPVPEQAPKFSSRDERVPELRVSGIK